MPKVLAQGKTIEYKNGANLRKVLLANDIHLYNGGSSVINCRGIGSCGTCAVEIEGSVSQGNWCDKTRRSLPPHSPERNLRKKCQTFVLGDLKLRNMNGFGDMVLKLSGLPPHSGK